MNGSPREVGAMNGKHIGVSGKCFWNENYMNKEGKFVVKVL